MTDDAPRPHDETQPVRTEGAASLPTPPDPATPAPAPAASEAHTTDPVARRGFRERLGRLRRTEGGDRSYGLAALVASALAGIIVGGLGLVAVHAIGDDGRDRGGWMQQRDADDRGPGRGGMHGGPRGVPGQLPPTTPTTPPEDDDSGSAS